MKCHTFLREGDNRQHRQHDDVVINKHLAIAIDNNAMKCKDERSPLLPISTRSREKDAADCDDTSGCTESLLTFDESPSRAALAGNVAPARRRAVTAIYAFVILVEITAVLFPLLHYAASARPAARGVAYVDLVRRAATGDAGGADPSDLGGYSTRCLAPDRPASRAVPAPRTVLLEMRNATLAPLSRASAGLEIRTPCETADLACVVDQVKELLRQDTTIVVAWEPTLMPKLLCELGVSEEKRAPKEGQGRRSEACDTPPWKKSRRPQLENGKARLGAPLPSYNACFDLVWQVKFALPSGEHSTRWEAVQVRKFQSGFEGSFNGPSAGGRAPLS